MCGLLDISLKVVTFWGDSIGGFSTIEKKDLIATLQTGLRAGSTDHTSAANEEYVHMCP